MRRQNRSGKKQTRGRAVLVVLLGLSLLISAFGANGAWAPPGTFLFYVQVAAGLYIASLLAIVIIGSGRHYKRLKAEREKAKKEDSGE